MKHKTRILQLLTIHESILNPNRTKQIMKHHQIMPLDIQLISDERASSPSVLETHHMIYRELGGSSKQRNEVTIPRHIHRRIHRDYPDMLPHEMIHEHTSHGYEPDMSSIYQSHIYPDLGIDTPDEINPIVAKYLQNQ